MASLPEFFSGSLMILLYRQSHGVSEELIKKCERPAKMICSGPIIEPGLVKERAGYW
jgi:hypothetical protein